MNEAVLTGRLTSDPELKTTQNGNAVCSFTLAVDRDFTGADGQRGTDFLRVIAWRKLAEICGKYLAKGRKVLVRGSIQQRSYQAQDGSKRYAFEIIADKVEFIGDRKSNDNGADQAQSMQTTQAAQGQTQQYAQQTTMQQNGGFTEYEDEDLPF